jgi:ubiquinol-cytochrome c reductase cytochrome b subunit
MNNKITRIKGIKRIGPHNIDVLSLIFGSLLGDGHAEYRLKGKGTRITFYQENSHVEYLLSIHKFLSERDYCSKNTPEISTRLGKGGKVRKIIRCRTWTYTSFNWIREVWYKDNIKCIPSDLEKYLTPLALAIWIMDDGTKSGKSLKFATNSFNYTDCLKLVQILDNKYKIKSSVNSAGYPNQYIIYIWKESMDTLREVVKPFIIPTMKNKIY